MRQKKFWFVISGILVLLAMVLMLPTGAVAAGKYKVLHRFTGHDGSDPQGALILDPAGNLYGTTAEGGGTMCGCGTVFKLTPNSNGSWTESVLYKFTGGTDGGDPFGGLIFDAAGNLYGTAQNFGASGFGTVFKLTPNSDGSWKESVLYSFTGGADGGVPRAGVIFDAAGSNLYGTTACCGAGKRGVVFELTSNSNGSWKESVLYSFTGGADGSTPYAGLIFDAAGKNLYGTTFLGGVLTSCGMGCGTVFKLTPNSNGSWTESVLYSFTSGAGRRPYAGVIFDAAGNLYGTATKSQKYGTVFKLTPNSDGSWTESVLHNFTGGKDGSLPYAGLTPDAAGNLYGATVSGGSHNTKCGSFGCGTVFKLTSIPDGSWAFSALHDFQGLAANPYAGVVLDKAGHLFGTTTSCVFTCPGAVFEIAP